MHLELKDFIKVNGHANIPRSYENNKLATWVHTQRKYKDKLSKERKEKLLALGFDFKN